MQDEPKVPDDVRKLAWDHTHMLLPIDAPPADLKRIYNGMIAIILADRATRPDAAGIAADMVRYRHVKRGSTYALIGYGKMQAERWEIVPDQPSAPIQKADMAEVAIYRSTDDGSLWVRPREEFEDGRFIEEKPL